VSRREQADRLIGDVLIASAVAETLVARAPAQRPVPPSTADFVARSGFEGKS
jgi:hypothetical protein